MERENERERGSERDRESERDKSSAVTAMERESERDRRTEQGTEREQIACLNDMRCFTILALIPAWLCDVSRP